MNKQSFGALLALNAVLLLALGFLALTPPPARAAVAGRANYIMLAGEAKGISEQVIYIIDLGSSKMIAVVFSSTNKQFKVIGGRILNDDIQVTGTGR